MVLLILAVFLSTCFIVAFLTFKNNSNKNKSKFKYLGYNYVGLSGLSYKGGIKNISVNNPVAINLLKEGLNFNSAGIEKIILFQNVKDISLQNENYIQNQVSLGKLFCFGILALGMSGKQTNVNDEFILLNVSDEEGSYNVILQSIDVSKNQEKINELLYYKNKKYLEKESI